MHAPTLRTPDRAAAEANKKRRIKVMKRVDTGRGLVYPDLHLSGRWLQALGFNIGDFCEIEVAGKGLITVRRLRSQPAE